MSKLIFYDFETSCLNPFHEEVIEYCFHSKTSTVQAMIKPTKKLAPIITKITGITDDMLEDKLSLEHHISIIFNFITTEIETDDIYLVAHNNDGFDKFFLYRMFKDDAYMKAQSKKWKHIDTILLAKMVLPNNRSYSLKTLCKYFNITEGTHRAEDDTYALQDVYCKLVYLYCIQNNKKYEEVMVNPSIIYDAIY
jgi:DNA polymerase-3 subunit alpha (Gram-positive type)